MACCHSQLNCCSPSSSSSLLLPPPSSLLLTPPSSGGCALLRLEGIAVPSLRRPTVHLPPPPSSSPPPPPSLLQLLCNRGVNVLARDFKLRRLQGLKQNVPVWYTIRPLRHRYTPLSHDDGHRPRTILQYVFSPTVAPPPPSPPLSSLLPTQPPPWASHCRTATSVASKRLRLCVALLTPLSPWKAL